MCDCSWMSYKEAHGKKIYLCGQTFLSVSIGRFLIHYEISAGDCARSNYFSKPPQKTIPSSKEDLQSWGKSYFISPKFPSMQYLKWWVSDMKTPAWSNWAEAPLIDENNLWPKTISVFADLWKPVQTEKRINYSNFNYCNGIVSELARLFEWKPMFCNCANCT